jgi:hypothetical protein
VADAIIGDEYMDQSNKITDRDVRHFIYTTFGNTAHPPTTSEVAGHFGVSIAEVEAAFERLAGDHQIALAPQSYSIWMAHPFSGLPTNFVTKVGGKKYWGN